MSKLMTESELKDPNLSDEQISGVFYRGLWEELRHLKHNPKLKGHDEDVWTYVAKDYVFFLAPWYPIFFIIAVMIINLKFNFYEPFYSLIFAAVGLFYVSKVIPLLNNIKESNRIKFIDKILEKSPFHRDLFVKSSDSVDIF